MATTVNNNFSAIRTHINTYLAQIDASNSWTAAQTFAAAVTCSSGNLTASGGELAVVRSGASAIMRMNSTGGSGRSWHLASQNSDGHLLVVDATAGSVRYRIDTDGHFLPAADGTYNSGGASNKWLEIYAATVTATSVGGTLTTAAQANVTSVGTLTGLTVSGTAALTTVTVSGTLSIDSLTLSAASSKIIPGATELLLRNTADSATNLTISNAGNITTRASTTTTISGDLVVSGQTTLARHPVCVAIPTSGGQTITAGNPILCATEEVDTDGMHSTSSNTGRFTVPAGMGGTYLCYARLAIDGSNTSVRWKLNNTTVFGPQVNTGFTGITHELTAVRVLSAGDYVEVRNTGGNTATLTVSTELCSMMVTRIN